MEYTSQREPQTLGEVFFLRAAELGERTFVRVEHKGRVDEISWRAFATKVRDLLLGLDASGFTQGAVTAIIAENRIEWLCADLATLAGGFPNVTLSPALSDKMLLRLLKHSSARAAFVEDHAGAERLLGHRNELSELREIFVMSTESASSDASVHTFDELMERGQAAPGTKLSELIGRVQVHDLATIMYTSGSTGEPKGVMRTQENILANLTSGAEIVLSKPEEMAVLVLSLNHLFGRFGFHKSVATGRTTAVVEATEKEVDIETIKALAPTTMSLVPRVIEKIFEKILEHDSNRSHWIKIETEWELHGNAGFLDSSPESKARRDSLTQSARALLGGRLKYVSYGGAPVPPHVARFFHVVRIPLIGSYGSTECGGVTVSGLDENDPTNLGKPFANVEIRLAEDGELLVRGPTVSPGYFKNPEATKEAFEPDGWYHTGDLGEISEKGSLRLVGRKKDVFNCADGSNIYPQQIEVLLEADPFIRQAILIGDQRPFITALLVPDSERVASELGSPQTAADEATLNFLRKRIERINTSLEDFEKVRKIAMITADFPPSVRTITVFQKVKVNRKAVAKEYAAEIAKLYEEEERRRRTTTRPRDHTT